MAQTIFTLSTLKRAFLGVSSVFALGLPLTFLANIVLARVLDVAAFGAYGFVLSVMTVLSIPIVSGLPMLLTREVSGYVQKDQISAYRGISYTAHVWVICFSLALLGILASAYFLEWSDRTLLIGALLLPILGLNAIRGGIMKGLGHPALSEIPNQLILPILLIIGFWILHQRGAITAETALIWYICASFLVFLIAYAILLWFQPKGTGNVPRDMADRPKWLRAILPFAAMSAVWTLTAQIAAVLLGLYGLDEDVAALRVAERAALLVSFPLMLINASIGPHIVNLTREKDTIGLRSTARFAARMACLAALPVCIFLLVLGKPLIALTFGQVYADIAYVPMVILVLGQTFSVFLGPAGIILVMAKFEKINLYIQIIGLIVFLGIAVSLIPMLGAQGAAIGAAAGVILSSTLAFIMVHRKLTVWTGIL